MDSEYRDSLGDTCQAKSARLRLIVRLDQLREELGRHIDPETAVVICRRVNIADPYGDVSGGPVCIGKELFARAPDSKVWIAFRDLPTTTKHLLSEVVTANDAIDDELPW